MSLTATVFLALLAIEVPLVALAVGRRTRVSAGTRILVFLLPVLVAFGLRAARALSTHEVLDWDEAYYLSIAVTAAGGDGLYPYIFGYGPMHAMGGIGYAAYSYALAVKLFGPTIFALRAVSLLASILGIAGIWVLVKHWYGSGAAWIAAGLTASLRLFALSNSARMDSWTFAYVAWALVAFAVAFERWREKRWHLAAGLVFGLGLQVHIDTVVTAFACGFLYLLRYVGEARESRRVWLPQHPMFLYLAGFAAGVVVYGCLNILPDAASYYATAVLVRLDATDTYSAGAPDLLSTFLNPPVLLAKEAARYRQLAAMTPPLEIVLAAAGLFALLVRRNAADRIVLPLGVAVGVAAAIVLNNPSPHYYVHVLPALIVPAAPLFSHGLTGRSNVSLTDLTPLSLASSVVAVCALCAINSAMTLRSIQSAPIPSAARLDTVTRIRSLVDRRCEIAGDGALYVPHFADYPHYVSLRDTEVRLGMLYYGTTDEAAYWKLKGPEVVLAVEPVRAGLAEYIASRQMTPIEPGVWITREGCRRAR